MKAQKTACNFAPSFATCCNKLQAQAAELQRNAPSPYGDGALLQWCGGFWCRMSKILLNQGKGGTVAEHPRESAIYCTKLGGKAGFATSNARGNIGAAHGRHDQDT